MTTADNVVGSDDDVEVVRRCLGLSSTRPGSHLPALTKNGGNLRLSMAVRRSAQEQSAVERTVALQGATSSTALTRRLRPSGRSLVGTNIGVRFLVLIGTSPQAGLVLWAVAKVWGWSWNGWGGGSPPRTTPQNRAGNEPEWQSGRGHESGRHNPSAFAVTAVERGHSSWSAHSEAYARGKAGCLTQRSTVQ